MFVCKRVQVGFGAIENKVVEKELKKEKKRKERKERKEKGLSKNKIT